MKIIFLLFTLMFGILGSQTLNLKKIEEKVLQNNRIGKQLASQKQLLQILDTQNATSYEEAKINYLLATTFRSINDYGSCINYLQKSRKIALHLNNADSLKINIDAEMAFTYFDNHDYHSAEKIIKDIMQEGYINFLQKKYKSAAIKYQESLSILDKNSKCNKPVVMVKQMQLYSALKLFTQVDAIYESTMKTADSCKIIKYKIYATEEIKNIYESKNNQQKAFWYSRKLHSLNVIDNRENKLSQMHVTNQNYLEEENENQKESQLIFILTAGFLSLILLFAGFYFYKKSKFHKIEKTILEAELKKIKEELKLYYTVEFSNEQQENAILNSKNLNKRQQEFLRLVSQGKSNKEIAEELSITEATVKYHLRNIYSILDIKNRKGIFGALTKK